MYAELMVVAAESPPVQPGLPYEQIGLVLVAMVTGMTAIVVAIIQKNKPSTPSTAPPATHGAAGFMVTEAEWITLRDRSLKTQAALEGLLHEYHAHDQVANEHMARTNQKLGAIEGRLGI